MADIDENAAIVNALQRHATVIVQKSLQEGFGLTVSEAMWKSRPVIGGDTGGIRLQIEDGRSGFLVGSVAACAERIVQLMDDESLRAEMGRTAMERVRDRFLTLRQLAEYLELMRSLS
jgi:trehalose synthase